MKGREQLNLIIMSIVLLMLIELVIYGGFGFGMFVAVGVYYGYILWRYREKGKIIEVIKDPLMLIIVALAGCFALFDNEILKIVNVLLIMGLMILHSTTVFGRNTLEKYTPLWFLSVVPTAIVMPFEHVAKAVVAIKEEVKTSQHRHQKARLLKQVLIGCVIGVPIVGVAIGLLASADAAFQGVIELIVESLSIDLTWLVGRGIVFGILFFPFMGYMYGLTHPSTTIYEPSSRYVPTQKTVWRLDFVIGVTVATLLAVIYGLYLVSQLSYFISAFSGVLPTAFTYAEYARRGFFEMIPLTLINLLVIGVLNILTTGKEEVKKASWLKGYMTYIGGFTLFLIVTALAKMVMYINTYGLTMKRVLASWLLVFAFVSLVLVGIKIYKESFRCTKWVFVAFSVLYIGLNYMNSDYIIAKYNTQLYVEKGGESIENLYHLSASSVGPYLEIEAQLPEAYDFYQETYQHSIEEKRKWQQENVARLNAKQKWEAHFR